jgi:hypothetical protein
MRRRLFAASATAILLAAAIPTSVTLAADGDPGVAVGDAVVTEPGPATRVFVDVPVTLEEDPGHLITFGWRTTPGTAGPEDYVEWTGEIVVCCGPSSPRIQVEILGDRRAEPDEWFGVELWSETGSPVLGAVGVVTIRDATNGLALGDASALEPDGQVSVTYLTVTLPKNAPRTVTFDWELRSGSAVVDSDFYAVSGTGTIEKGWAWTVIAIPIKGDDLPEERESFDVVVTSVTNARLADGSGTFWIEDDDAPPST